MTRYSIRGWNDHFENNRTRELIEMRWVPLPNRMDGFGYTSLIDHANGAAHFGAWVAIVEIASRQKPRGTFPQHGAGFSQVLARISRIPAAVFDEAIPRLIQIGWIEELTSIPQDGAGLGAVALTGMEWNGKKGMEGTKSDLSLKLREVLCQMFERNTSDAWDYYEESLLPPIIARPNYSAELAGIQRFIRGIKEPQFRPQSVRSLLDKWTHWVDKSKMKTAKNTVGRLPRIKPGCENL